MLFKKKPDEYDLTTNETFPLIYLLYRQTNIEEIKALQQSLLLELIEIKPLLDILVKFKIFNKQNYLNIFTIKNKQLVNQMLAALLNKHVRMTQHTLNMIIYLYKHELSIKANNCVMVLIEHGLIFPELWPYLLEDNITHYLADILLLMTNINHFHLFDLMKILKSQNLPFFPALFENIHAHQLNLSIVDSLCDCSMKVFYWLPDLINILTKFTWFNKNIFNVLVQTNEETLMSMLLFMRELGMQTHLEEREFYVMHDLLSKNKYLPSYEIKALLQKEQQYCYASFFNDHFTRNVSNNKEKKKNEIQYQKISLHCSSYKAGEGKLPNDYLFR